MKKRTLLCSALLSAIIVNGLILSPAVLAAKIYKVKNIAF